MARKSCENCMWAEQCGAEEVCSYYDPLDEEYETQIDDMREFYREWNAYINLWNNG